MAAKKTTKKTVPAKSPKKPAAKPVKAAAPAHKAATAKKSSAKPAPAPTKKDTPVSKKKSPAPKAPVKAAMPAEKLAAKPVPAPAVVKPAAKPAAKKESKPAVKKSSLVDYPVPPPPVKPPFVPPKPAIMQQNGEQHSQGGSGKHSDSFIQKQHQRLLDLRDELVDAMSGMTRDTIRNAPEGSEASGSGQHQGDAGSDAYDRDFALSVLAKEQDALYEIEQALRRIQTGTYGICEMSQRKIPQARLEAIPFARLTVECQAQWEKEYGNRRFRSSSDVGFSGGKHVDDEDSETVSLDEEED